MQMEEKCVKRFDMVEGSFTLEPDKGINIDKILKDREKEILIRRFGLNGHKPETQNEIAKDLGISRSYVSRIETKAIKKLEAKLKKD